MPRNARAPNLPPERSAHDVFLFQCRVHRLPEHAIEYQFARELGRMHRFDVAWPRHKLAVEIDGGIFTQGAHGNPGDILRNMTKGNDAVLLGWYVLHFTPHEVTTGHAIEFTQRVLPRLHPS